MNSFARAARPRGKHLRLRKIEGRVAQSVTMHVANCAFSASIPISAYCTGTCPRSQSQAQPTPKISLPPAHRTRAAQSSTACTCEASPVPRRVPRQRSTILIRAWLLCSWKSLVCEVSEFARNVSRQLRSLSTRTTTKKNCHLLCPGSAGAGGCRGPRRTRRQRRPASLAYSAVDLRVWASLCAGTAPQEFCTVSDSGFG